MTYRAKHINAADKRLVDAARARAASAELELLRAIEPHEEGIGFAAIPGLSPGAIDTLDRLVANGDVARYPGCLYGLSDAGRKRLTHSVVPS